MQNVPKPWPTFLILILLIYPRYIRCNGNKTISRYCPFKIISIWFDPFGLGNISFILCEQGFQHGKPEQRLRAEPEGEGAEDALPEPGGAGHCQAGRHQAGLRRRHPGRRSWARPRSSRRHCRTGTLIKKKIIKFSSSIRKFRCMGAVAKSYMRKGFLIYEEVRNRVHEFDFF
jgi:hypothetical protein